MGIGAMEVVVIFLVAALNLLPLVGIVSAAMFDRETWSVAGKDKAMWIVLQLLTGFIGASIYLLFVRRTLRAIEQDGV